MRASVRGLIDFRQADWRDRNWWRRFRLVCQELVRESDIALLGYVLQFQSSFLSDGKLSDDGFREVQQRCQQLLQHLNQRLLPWEKQTGETAVRDKYDELIEQYKSIFGDPKSPEFQAKQAQAIAAAKAAREQAEAEERARQERIASRRRRSATRKSS